MHSMQTDSLCFECFFDNKEADCWQSDEYEDLFSLILDEVHYC